MNEIIPLTAALDMRQHLNQHNPVHIVVSFSGGRDSTVMLDGLVNHYAGRHPIHVVFADTGWEHPDAEAWCRSIVEDSYGLPLL